MSTTAEQDAAIERCFLGSILTVPKLFREIEISADDFSLPSLQSLYRAMAKLDEEGMPIDQALLCDVLHEKETLDPLGDGAFIAGLLDGCIPEHAGAYAKRIRKAATQRRSLNLVETARSKLDNGEPPEKVFAELSTKFGSLTSDDDSLGHSYDEIMNAPDVTFAIDPFLPEQGTTLIAGLAGDGKTWVMLSMCRALLEGGKLFHHFPVKRHAHKVIYLIPECGLGPFAQRLKMFGLTDYVKDGRLIVRTLSKRPIRLDDPLLLRAAPEADIFLDTVTRFKSGDENDAAENAEFAENLFRLQRAGARTITGAHHAPKNFAREKSMTLENIVRGSGDIGAMLSTCWGIRQIHAKKNRIFVENVKARDFLPCEPFIIQGRPALDVSGQFELTEPPGCAGQLGDHLSKAEKCGRPALDQSKAIEARRLRDEGMSYRKIAEALRVSHGSVGNLLENRREDMQ